MVPGGPEVRARGGPRQFIKPGVTVDEPEAEGEYRREMAEDIRAQQALRRRGLPEEQASAIAFLASAAASYVTGQSIVIDGGNIIQEYRGSHHNQR